MWQVAAHLPYSLLADVLAKDMVPGLSIVCNGHLFSSEALLGAWSSANKATDGGGAAAYQGLYLVATAPTATAPTGPSSDSHPSRILSKKELESEEEQGGGGGHFPTGSRSGTVVVPPICYEVVRVQQQRYLALSMHLNRLEGSIAATHLGEDIAATTAAEEDKKGSGGVSDSSSSSASSSSHHSAVALAARQYIDAHIAPACRQVVQMNAPFDLNVKIVVWRSEGEASEGGKDQQQQAAVGAPPRRRTLNSIAYAIKSFYPPPEWYRSGITMGLLADAVRTDPNAKAIQATLRTRAAEFQTSAAVFETLLVGPAPAFAVPEGSRSNYITVNAAGEVVCSPDHDILVGVTLQIVKKICAEEGIPFIQRPMSIADLLDPMQCAALAMTGTSVGVLPIRTLRCAATAPWRHLPTPTADPLAAGSASTEAWEASSHPTAGPLYVERHYASATNPVLLQLMAKLPAACAAATLCA